MPSMKNGNLISPVSPSAPKNLAAAYFLAARPRTWISGIAPVCIGTSMVKQPIDYAVFGLALFFSLLIQIGTNYANDYFDFIKGADTPSRIGPARATASGWITPSDMKRATVFVFLSAVLVALPLMFRVGMWSLLIVCVCVLFGVLYTGGPKPLGYLGLGEILVLLFFGPVACLGSYFLQTHSLDVPPLIASLAPGFLSTGTLVANNLRDYEEDAKAGKKTLIVRFGRKFGGWEYGCCVVLAGFVPLLLFSQSSWLSIAPMLILPLSIPLIRTGFLFEHPKELLSVLQRNSLLLLLYTVLFCLTWN